MEETNMTENISAELAAKNEKYADFARKYTEFLIVISKDAELYNDLVVHKDQAKLKTALRMTGINLPENAFVMLDEQSMYAKAYLIGKDDKHAASVVEQSLNVKVDALSKQGIVHTKTDNKLGIDEIRLEVPAAATDFSILVLLPFYAITNLEMKFTDGAEIILSSC